MKITIGETTYPSIKAAAIGIDMPSSTLRYRIKHGIDLTVPINFFHSTETRRHPYLVSKLPEYIRLWLLASVPEGSTATDFILAIITDAYHDEGAPNGDGTD